MANTFKVKTLSAIKSDSADTLYSCAQSTTAVLLGLTVTNTNTTSAITCTATLESDTSETKTVASADDTTETNTNVTLLPATEIPIASSLEFFSGQKVVLQATDKLKVQTNKSGLSMDCTLSLMEIT